MTVNGTFQVMNGKPFSFTDLTIASATSALTTGASLFPSLYINASGALLSAQITGDDPQAQVSKTVGAGAGSVAGSYVSTGLDFVSNSNAFGKYSPVVNRYIKYTQPVAASYIQEKVSDRVEDKFQK